MVSINRAKYLYIVSSILSFFLILATVSCQNQAEIGGANPGGEPVSRSAYLLGTSIHLTLHDHGTDEVFGAILARLEEIDRTMSLQRSDSVLSEIRRKAGKEAVKVPADILAVIVAALDMAERSGGAFDPAIGPLVSAWDITGTPRVPSLSEIDALLPLCNWQDVVVDKDAGTVYLKKEGMALDLGAIAKGYAADEAARIARERGVRNAILDLGGNLYVLGQKPGKDFWRIGIQNPDAERGQSIGIVPLVDATAVTSGAYERYFEQDGKRYHHILSPFTGYPSDSDLIQVTVVSKETSMYCDGLTTACFVLGLEKGLALLEASPGYEGILVGTDHRVHLTSGLKDTFTISDSLYTLAD